MAVLLIVIFGGQQLMDKSAPPQDGLRFGNAATQLELIVQGKAVIFQNTFAKAVPSGNVGFPGIRPQDPFDQIAPKVRDGAACRAIAALRLYADPNDTITALHDLDSFARELEEGEALVHALAKKEIETPGTLTDDEQAALRYQMHWFAGPLFLARADPDDPGRHALTGKSTVVILYFFFAILAAIGGFLVGIALLGAAAVKHRAGTLSLAFQPGRSNGTAYLLSFIIFIGIMSLQFVLIIANVVVPLAGVAIFSGSFVGALVCAFLLTEGSFKERRRALGLHRGRGILREIGASLVGYCAVIPVAAIGGLISFALFGIMAALGLGADEAAAGHPIQDLFFDAPISARIGLLLLAAVAAPLIEETMFRGLLYRGLRQWMPMLVSGLLMGTAFALVHPQMFAVLPILAALGLGFGLLREWRDSLIAPMVAHGLHNGILITGLWLMVL